MNFYPSHVILWDGRTILDLKQTMEAEDTGGIFIVCTVGQKIGCDGVKMDKCVEVVLLYP